MSDTMIAALIAAGTSLIVTVGTLVANARVEMYKSKSEMRQKGYQSKRECLDEVYKKLISSINLYPNASPNDVLKYVKYPPNYSMETFDSIIKILDFKIEYYKQRLDNTELTYEQKVDIDMEISVIEYSKKRILEIRDKYYYAYNEYKTFCESDKVMFDLYAGQDVKNCLVEFEVVIHNVFIAGYSVGDADDPLKNIIEIKRRNLINSIRNDIGVF